MSKNRLQALYTHFEKEFASCEDTFLAAEKHRLQAKVALEAILSSVNAASEKLAKYPQATVLKRIGLIETLIKDLEMRYQAERRHFNALGFLLSRLRGNLAVEMLEPKLYAKIRASLEREETLKVLREKYPDSEAVLTVPKPLPPQRPEKSIRLMLISAANLHYAIPVQRILKRTPAAGAIAEKLRSSGYKVTTLPVDGKASTSYNHAVAYNDLKDQRRMLYCDEYFKPVEIPQRLLKKVITYVASGSGSNLTHRPQLKFYGRHFFVYGARLTYTVRTGGRANSSER